MRKLMIVIITILAVFTFIREYSPNPAPSHAIQHASAPSPFHD